MTTKQAALLAGVGTILRLLVQLVPSFWLLMTPSVWHDPRNVLSVLLIFLPSTILMAALPVFFVCVYLNEPPLVIPERLRRPALVAVIATGLSGAQTTFRVIRDFISSWGMEGYPSMRESHSLQFWQWPLSVLTAILVAIVVPLFFYTISRSSAEAGPVNPRLKKAAIYAGLAVVAGAAATVYSRSSTESDMSTHQALLAARGVTPGPGLWYRILQTALALFSSGSLAIDLLLFQEVPTTIHPAVERQRTAIRVESPVMDALALHRFHFAFHHHLPLPLSAVDHGAGAAHRDPEDHGQLRTGEEHYNRAARFWAKIFAINFAMGVVTGIPMEFQFGTNWAPFSKARRRRHRPDSRHGGSILVLPRIDLPGAVPVRREAPGAAGALVGGFHGLPRIVALGLLHHRHERLDAASGGLRAGAGRRVMLASLLGAPAEPLDPLAVPAQHDRRGGDGGLRHGLGRRVLPAAGQARPNTGGPFSGWA